jgi:outer membrane protein assembly factor BamE (lipoprotein component of BamABCDE complex)
VIARRVLTLFAASAATAAALLVAGCANTARFHVLTDDQLAAIQPGMTRDEVLRRLGPPVDTMKFPRSGTEAWDYMYQDTWGYLVRFSATFGPDGRVVSKIGHRLNDGGDHAGR